MSDVDQWSKTEASNNAASPDGFPELMNRSGLNDSSREVMASVKRMYDDPYWRDPFVGFTLARSSGGVWTLADGGGKTDASGLFAPLGAGFANLIKIEQGGNTWIGAVSNAVYASTITTLTIAWNEDYSQDTTGPTTATNATIEILWGMAGDAALRTTGTASGQVPTVGDLDPSAFIASSLQDVGFLDGQTREEIVQAGSRGRANFNGDPVVWTRGASFAAGANDDLDVCADGYTIISDGNDRVDVIRSTDAPSGLRYSLRLEAQSTQNFGLVHPIELDDCIDLCDSGVTDKVCGSFYARLDETATGIDSLRCYLMRFNTTAPGDPVTSWPAVDADMATSSNWTIVDSATITLTSAWQRFTPFTDLDASSATGGLALVVHVNEATIAAGMRFFLTGFQVNFGDKQVPFIRRPIADELLRAQRYCISTFDDGVTPAHNQGNAQALVAAANSAGDMVANWRFPISMYATPTVVTFNPGDAAPATGNWEDSASADRAEGTTTISTRAAQLTCTTGTASLLHYIAAYAHANIVGNN